MKESSAIYLIFAGLIVTAFGAGGVEHSITNTQLLQSLAVSLVGLLILAAGTVALNHVDSSDK